MDTDSGRAPLNFDEEFKQLRMPHSATVKEAKEKPETSSRSLSITAEEFVPKTKLLPGTETPAANIVNCDVDVAVNCPSIKLSQSQQQMATSSSSPATSTSSRILPPAVAAAATINNSSSSPVQRRLLMHQHQSAIVTQQAISPPAQPATSPTMPPATSTNNNYNHTIPPQAVFTTTSSVQNRLKFHSNFGGGGDGSGDNTLLRTFLSQHQHSLNQHDNSEQSFNSANNSQIIATQPIVEVETIALDYLSTVIKCLNENPGSFDTIATRFLNIFEGMENNQYVLSNAMEDIFNHSINNPNFRYMGAKLYNLLHMLNLRQDSLFHTLLKCKLDYHQKEVVEYMKSQQLQHKVRETALFLAELYMQLRGDDLRIHLIAENIVFSLKQLLPPLPTASALEPTTNLQKNCSDNIRCICLTLKLAGYDLDIDSPNDIKFIIDNLDQINTKYPGKYPLIANIISLQRKNWGRKLTNSLSQSSCGSSSRHSSIAGAETTSAQNDYINGPTLYGPDGKVLTEEESYFLSENAQHAAMYRAPIIKTNGYNLLNGHISNNSGGGSVSLGLGGNSNGGGGDDDDIIDSDIEYDAEMDEDAEKEYRKFCKLATAAAAAAANTTTNTNT